MISFKAAIFYLYIYSWRVELILFPIDCFYLDMVDLIFDFSGLFSLDSY